MKKYLLNDNLFVELLKKNKVVVVDGGARGQLFKPLNFLNSEIVQVVRFEPDADAEVEAHSGNDIIIRQALWNQEGEIDINIAIQESASSVYPFNRKLQKSIDPFYDIRKTKKVVKVNTTNLDALVASGQVTGIDFIKLDIHGAEYEVLEGADKVLTNTLGLLIESWIIPIHLGQKLRSSVELLAYRKGFYVFEEYNRANWGRMNSTYLKKQPVVKDTLFFKDPIIEKTPLNQIQAIKLIGLSELFGHIAYAWQLMEYFYEQNILEDSWFQKIKHHLEKNTKPTFKEKLYTKMGMISNELFNTCSFK